ncbi:FYVE, RhoGEF and PH domain-containing protein 4-like [Cololabis saira]|uniref:FYVE, RhoGEF and PH domain-containing protein 4-like n=1 Tax=Cololabis saira TaxID=129043 RepID=UPI002AD58563|nr:FYVE, RhoGEF and PH domain-containing protein 4-like [Cololabis saira]
MFDLKKRNSLTLRVNRETEEFRRVAIRRRDKSVVDECHVSDVSGGVCGLYSCGRACDSFRGPIPNSKAEGGGKNPAKRSPLKPEVPPEPAHLQSPKSPRRDQGCTPAAGKVSLQQVNGAEPDRSPSRDYGVSLPCVSPALSPVGGGVSYFLSPASWAHLGPASHAQGLPSGPVLGSPSPGKRGIQSCSPLREGGHSPAKLSPRNHSPLMGKLRTPSPVQKRMGSYSPARNSKSWLGLNRISNEQTERREKKVEKAVSVPDLVIYMDEGRISAEKGERWPLKPLQSASRDGPGISINAPADCRLRRTSSEEPSSNNKSGPSQQTDRVTSGEDWPEVHGTGMSDKMEGGVKLTRHGSRYSCEWTKTPADDERTHRESRGEEHGEEGTNEPGESEPKEEEDAENKLYKIANELLQTERAYVARLHLLDQVFCSRLTDEADRGSFPLEVVRNIFSNVSSIYSFHSQFLLPDLENCICCWRESPGLGKALLQHAPFLRMYADYVRNFDQAMELVRTWTERSSAFRNVIQEIQSQDVCGHLTLQHHMLEPVQRVPRYELLLRDYLKKLPGDDPDYELSQKSLQAISMAATHSNSAILKAESLKRLLEIYEMVGEEEVVNPTNEFLREGRLLKLAARNTSAMERHLFLFNNFLLCCSPKFSLVGQRFTVRCRIGVDGMHVHQTTNEDHPFTFQVSGKEKTVELQASCEQERDEWIKAVQEAIDVFQQKHETFKLASRELNVEDPMKELGRRAPRWIRDNEVTLCMTCREPFNAITRRRHHCRACGFVVCWKCSDNKVALEYDGNKPNKVCKACYSILTGRRGERADRKKRRTLDAEAGAGARDGVMSGFLQHGDDSGNLQTVWCVLTGTDPPVLHVQAAQQDVKPLFSLPLLGCMVEVPPQELSGQHSFCLKRSKAAHVFSCDGPDARQSWLTALKVAVTGRMPPSLTVSADGVSGVTSSMNANVVCRDEESAIGGVEENLP